MTLDCILSDESILIFQITDRLKGMDIGIKELKFDKGFIKLITSDGITSSVEVDPSNYTTKDLDVVISLLVGDGKISLPDDLVEELEAARNDPDYIKKQEAGLAAKERLEQAIQEKEIKAGRMVRLAYVFIGLICWFIVIAGLVSKWIWDNRTMGDEVLFGSCQVRVGGELVEGRRSFVRPFTDILGIRFIDSTELYEELIIENHHPELIVASMDGEDSTVVIFDESQGLNVEIPLGEKYLFVYKGNSQIVTHSDLCN